jgi:hypothetical protein
MDGVIIPENGRFKEVHYEKNISLDTWKLVLEKRGQQGDVCDPLFPSMQHLNMRYRHLADCATRQYRRATLLLLYD